jgi:O-antigen/teichoic acid export membrane protein
MARLAQPSARPPPPATEFSMTSSLSTLFKPVKPEQWAHAKKWSLRLIEIGLVQGLVQFLTALTGLLIVRTLAKQDYAVYAITNSMQAAANILADLGISLGVRSIGGRVCEDRQRYGQLLNSALKLRGWFATVSLGVTVPIAAWMLWRNGASWVLTLALCLTIVASLTPLLASSIWITSLQLHGQYRRLQKIDLSNAALRLMMIGGLMFSYLSALTAALTVVVSNWVQLIWLKKHAVELADTRQPPNAEDIRELKKLSFKMLPNSIFFCLQSQITVWLITVFGNVNNVADVSALGRISMLFLVLHTTMDMIVMPRFSRIQEPNLLFRRYAVLIFGCLVVSSLALIAAALFSTQFLWLLGPKYSHLKPELILVMLSAVTNFVAGTMWGVNVSRAWIKAAPLYIPVTLATQVLVLLVLDVSTVRGVLWFGFWSLVPSLFLNGFSAWTGFRQLFQKGGLVPVKI